MKKGAAMLLTAAIVMSTCFTGLSYDVKAAETEAEKIGEDAGSSAGDSDELEVFAQNAAKAKNDQKSTWTDNAEFTQYEIGSMSFVLPNDWKKESEDVDGTLYFETETAMLMVMYDDIDEDTMKEIDLTDKEWQDTFMEGMKEEIDLKLTSQKSRTFTNVKGFEAISEVEIDDYVMSMDLIVVQDEKGLYEFLIYNFNDDVTFYSDDLNNIVDTLAKIEDTDTVAEIDLKGITENAGSIDTTDTNMAVSSSKTKQYKTAGMYLVDVSEDWKVMDTDDEEDTSIYFENDNAMLQIDFGQLSLLENGVLDLTDKSTQKELMDAICDVDELGVSKTSTETVKLSGMDGFKFTAPAEINGEEIEFEAIILHSKAEGIYMFYIYNFSGENGLYEKELETIADSLTVLERVK